LIIIKVIPVFCFSISCRTLPSRNFNHLSYFLFFVILLHYETLSKLSALFSIWCCFIYRPEVSTTCFTSLFVILLHPMKNFLYHSNLYLWFECKLLTLSLQSFPKIYVNTSLQQTYYFEFPHHELLFNITITGLLMSTKSLASHPFHCTPPFNICWQSLLHLILSTALPF
jgi:hypothetical protein